MGSDFFSLSLTGLAIFSHTFDSIEDFVFSAKMVDFNFEIVVPSDSFFNFKYSNWCLSDEFSFLS
uniref:Uncharacterized protein n=1 Tax=Lepeophtheirus salmonis TaxID=72036 RepID=A0A0K2UIN9_LEPSM